MITHGTRMVAQPEANALHVRVFADTDLVHSAYVTTGLIELAGAGKISLDWGFADPRVSRPRSPYTLWLVVRDGARRARIVVDHGDYADRVCLRSLVAADWYYNANVNERTYAFKNPGMFQGGHGVAFVDWL
jgi:hypothetical protein